MRNGYGEGPVLLRIAGRNLALVLSADHVRRVLEGSPDPFDIAGREKRAALSHFQPNGVLISHGSERAVRRRLNEAALDSSQPIHRLGDELVATARDEATVLVAEAERSGSLTWGDFSAGWWRAVRRIVLGDVARDEVALTDALWRLRRDANWAYLKPKRTALRDLFLDRLEDHLSRAEPGSLAAVLAATPPPPASEPAHQVSHWLFAFDAAGMASFRALALIDANPRESERARHEALQADMSRPQPLPFLRACMLESLRLWPTTPAILRETSTETRWDSGTMPPKTAALIFVPYFHRNRESLAGADSFTPDIWLNGHSRRDWPLVPFSAGPAECPGRNLVLLVTSSMLATLLENHRLRQLHPRPLVAGNPLPGTLSPFRLRFGIAARQS